MATTTAVAVPLSTLVPMKHRLDSSSTLFESAAGSLSNFSTGMASPVSADWFTNRSLAESTRKSAGIMSPADTCTTSPGTRRSIGTSTRAGD